jgi:hypothetical protein
MNSRKPPLAHDGWLDDDAHEALDILQLLGHVTTLLRPFVVQGHEPVIPKSAGPKKTAGGPWGFDYQLISLVIHEKWWFNMV